MLLVVAERTVVLAVAQPFEGDAGVIGTGKIRPSAVVAVEAVVGLLERTASGVFERFRVLRVVLFAETS